MPRAEVRLLFHAKVGRFGLEMHLSSVEGFTDGEPSYQHLRGRRLKGVDKDLGKRDGRDEGGSKKETFIPHSAHIFSCFSVCGDCRLNAVGSSFPLPST